MAARAARVVAVVPPAPTTFSMMMALAERLRHMVGDDARDDVGRTAGRERHDHGDGARRIGLRLRLRG